MNPSAGPSQARAAHNHQYGWVVLLIIGPLTSADPKLFPALDQLRTTQPARPCVDRQWCIAGGHQPGAVYAPVTIHAQDGRIYLVGMGFLGIASVFLIHAISTPNVLISGRGLATAWSAPLSLSLGAGFFALSGLSSRPR